MAASNGNPKTYTYTGKGGVPIGSLWHRLLYAAKFADVNILLSDRVNSASKIIYDRTPRERVMKAAPWLTVDGDAYPAVVEGRIVWIVDGYTTSNSYPYSKRVALSERDVRLADQRRRHRGRPAATRRQLHAQLGEGRGRRVRRHRQAVRLGRHRPGAADLGEGVPRGRAAEVGHLDRPARRTSATRRTCSRCSARSSAATT